MSAVEVIQDLSEYMNRNMKIEKHHAKLYSASVSACKLLEEQHASKYFGMVPCSGCDVCKNVIPELKKAIRNED